MFTTQEADVDVPLIVASSVKVKALLLSITESGRSFFFFIVTALSE